MSRSYDIDHAAEAAKEAAPVLLRALKEMVEAYREGVADDEEPTAVCEALQAIAMAERLL